jgi:hypothetical protein
VATLSEWLQLMLEEIARKRDAEQGARAEEARRDAEQSSSAPPPAPTAPPR